MGFLGLNWESQKETDRRIVNIMQGKGCKMAGRIKGDGFAGRMEIRKKEEVNSFVSEARGERFCLVVATALHTGMRREELMALRWENVDFDGRRIFVESSKRAKSIRVIPMADEAYDALTRQRAMQDMEKEKAGGKYLDQGIVFADPLGNRLSRRQFMEQYSQLLQAYQSTNVHFSRFRHMFFQQLVDSGVPMETVWDLLG